MKACVLPRCATELSLGCLHGLCSTDISLLQATGAAWSPVRLCMPLHQLSAYTSSTRPLLATIRIDVDSTLLSLTDMLELVSIMGTLKQYLPLHDASQLAEVNRRLRAEHTAGEMNARRHDISVQCLTPSCGVQALPASKEQQSLSPRQMMRQRRLWADTSAGIRRHSRQQRLA